MKVVIIGTGNTATVLGRLINQSGHSVIQIYGRTGEPARQLAERLNTGYTTALDEIDVSGDLYLIAVSDSAITVISTQLQLHNKLVVHTAGSVSKEVLKRVSKNYGVLYPLQSLRKEAETMAVVPFLVDGNTSDDLTLLYDFACTLSSQVQIAGDDERKRYHLTAVLVNNFSNHLYTLAREYCGNSKIDFNFLLPLIQQLPQQLINHIPQELQTGPAIRNDRETIEKQLALLQDYPEIKNLYTLFTKSIQEHYNVR